VCPSRDRCVPEIQRALSRPERRLGLVRYGFYKGRIDGNRRPVSPVSIGLTSVRGHTHVYAAEPWPRLPPRLARRRCSGVRHASRRRFGRFPADDERAQGWRLNRSRRWPLRRFGSPQRTSA